VSSSVVRKCFPLLLRFTLKLLLAPPSQMTSTAPSPIPPLNAAPRSDVPEEIVSKLKAHFEPRNLQLFKMLGHPLWTR